MLNDEILRQFNLQITREFHCAYTYFSMSLYFKERGLCGLENVMKQQSHGEIEHASKMIDYIYNRNSQVRLETVDAPHYSFSNAFEVFETALEHEKIITKSLCTMLESAKAVQDYMSEAFIQKFIDGQAEEENFFNQILKKCSLIKDDQISLIIFDGMLSK